MKTLSRRIVPALTLLIAGMAVACMAKKRADVLFLSEHTGSDVRSAGFAGGGCAMPGGVTTAFTNPALPNSYAQSAGVRGLLSSIGYGRDQTFSRHVLSGGVAYCNAKSGTVGDLSKYYDAGDGRKVYETGMLYSGKLFERSTDQGSVDFGMTARYQKMNWRTAEFDTLYSCSTYYSPRGTVDSIRDSTPYGFGQDGNDQAHRLLLDVGFFQGQIAERLDFGLVFHDLLGYVWRKSRPRIHRETVVPDTMRPLVRRDSASYVDEYQTRNGWIDSWYRRLTVGMAYHVPVAKDKAVLTFPLDLEFMGLFAKGIRTRVALRVGIGVSIKESYFVRFGYARKPSTAYYGEKFPENESFFSGGGGIRLGPVVADVFFGRSQWGMQASLNY